MPDETFYQMKARYEADLVYVKGVMYGTLAFFLTMSGFTMIMITIWLVFTLLLNLAGIYFLLNIDPELTQLILNHLAPKLFPIH
jgi:hypothetical protein